MFTRLRSRKERAYTVSLELEERTVHLPSSPHAVAWDAGQGRLLYHRADWVHRVVKGTDEIYDFGVLRTVICEAPAGAPLESLGAGRVWAVLAVDEPGTFSSYIGDPRVECMAVDPVSGNVVVYWHRESVFEPFETIVQVFSATGSNLGSFHQVQPADLNPRWSVPHAIVSGDFVYAVERGDDEKPAGLPGTGRVVRRGVGTIGSLGATWSASDPWTFPHSLAIDPETETLYVLATRLWHALTPSAFQRSYLIALSAEDLDFRWQVELTFQLESGPYPYFMGSWQPAGDSNTGGMFFRDHHDGTFVSSAQDPATYDPNPLVPLERNLFRWTPVAGGQVVEGLGGLIPCPIFPVLSPSPEPAVTAVLGAWFAELPQVQEV